MDGIVTHIYCKHLANLQLGLGHSPGLNECFYVVMEYAEKSNTYTVYEHKYKCI